MLLKKIHRSRTNKYVIPVRLHKSARLNNFKPSGLICYYFFPSVFLSFSLFHSRLNFIDRISWLSVLCKNKFPQIKITAKIYSRGNTVFSNLNSLHENTVQRNRVCSITTGLFFSETNTDAHSVKIANQQKFRSTRYPLEKWSVVWSTRARSLFLVPYLRQFRFIRLPL